MTYEYEESIQWSGARVGDLLTTDFEMLSPTDQKYVIQACTRLLRKKLLRTCRQPAPLSVAAAPQEP